MPRYDYRCRTCDDSFEVRRGLDEPPAPVACPQGHLETSRVFTAVAVARPAGAAAPAGPPAPAASGGCCGSGCCG